MLYYESEILFFLMAAFFFLLGCSSDDDDVIPQMEENSQYYVKYEVSVAFSSEPNMEITYLSDKGEQTTTVQSSEWEGTYGPFPKNAKFSIGVTPHGTINNTSDSYVRLSVSKNGGPFVIKGEDTETRKPFFQITYTVDF